MRKTNVTLKRGSARLQVIQKKMEHFNVLKNQKINSLTSHYAVNMPLHGKNISNEEKKPMCSHNMELLAIHVVPKFIIVLA